MAPRRPPSPPPSWTVIAIGYVVFAFFLVGAAVAYAFLVSDLRFTCERAADSCEVTEVKLFWRDVTHRFQPSQVVRATHYTGKRLSCAVVEMAGGAPEVRICPKTGEEYVALLNDFVAQPSLARLDYNIGPSIIDYMFVGVILFFSLIPFYGTTSEAIRKLRTSA